MKKIVLIPDSFKGTLSSSQICGILGERIKYHFPNCNVVSIPVADGGEGSVDCFLAALGGKKVSVTVKGPYFEDMQVFYGLLPDGTAVIEMAACAGLPLAGENKNPALTTTYGVGQLILHAAKQGCKKIIVGLGGSCTNDAGAGAAAAVGIKFINKKGEVLTPTGKTLCEVAKIDFSEKTPLLQDVQIITMCDIDNPLYGPTGAAYVFAPQKGADEEMVKQLDKGLVSISEVIKRDLNMDVSAIPGGGAAGGMGAGMVAFFGASLKMGIETVLDTVGFDNVINGADLVITGEGRLDSRSLRGKVVYGVARRANPQNIPVIVIAGGYEPGIDEFYNIGVTAVFSTNPLPEDFSISRRKSAQNLKHTADNIIRLIKNISKK